MILIENITIILESVVKTSITLVIESSLNACKELTKFIIILLIAYYIAEWLFQFWDEVLQNNEVYLKVGQPDAILIKSIPSLVDQLEIEAEFEENKQKLMKRNPDFKELISRKEEKQQKSSLQPKDSDEGVIARREIISLIEQGPNETSRPSQTKKTSLGKKSKLKAERNQENDNNNNENRDSKTELEVKELLENLNPQNLNETDLKPQSYDDEYDRESFHRT